MFILYNEHRLDFNVQLIDFQNAFFSFSFLVAQRLGSLRAMLLLDKFKTLVTIESVSLRTHIQISVATPFSYINYYY